MPEHHGDEPAVSVRLGGDGVDDRRPVPGVIGFEGFAEGVGVWAVDAKWAGRAPLDRLDQPAQRFRLRVGKRAAVNVEIVRAGVDLRDGEALDERRVTACDGPLDDRLALDLSAGVDALAND